MHNFQGILFFGLADYNRHEKTWRLTSPTEKHQISWGFLLQQDTRLYQQCLYVESLTQLRFAAVAVDPYLPTAKIQLLQSHYLLAGN